jgi:hypothetical protein
VYISGCVTLIMNPTTQIELNTLHLFQHYTICDNNMYICHKFIEICFLFDNIAMDLFVSLCLHLVILSNSRQ